jgi:peptidoglycan/LPS O-acetylase OafA/YrhL
LLPAYAFTLFFVWTLLDLLPDGPFSHISPYLHNDCPDYWWANLLFLNNFVPDWRGNDLCVGWAWYLANDMQFFLITPPIIWLYYKLSPKHGWGCAAVLILTTIVTSMGLA